MPGLEFLMHSNLDLRTAVESRWTANAVARSLRDLDPAGSLPRSLARYLTTCSPLPAITRGDRTRRWAQGRLHLRAADCGASRVRVTDSKLKSEDVRKEKWPVLSTECRCGFQTNTGSMTQRKGLTA